jgi:hypothetical protein
MITLIIVIGIYAIQCIGSNCYSIDKGTVDILTTAGLLESIYEIKNVISIYRKKGR